MFTASRLGYWYILNPLSVAWTTTQNGIIAGIEGGWQISNGGLRIRYDMQDSANCGGPNSNVQTGTAVGSISTGQKSYTFVPALTGFGEAQDPGFEIMELFLAGGSYGTGTGTKLTRAVSSGGNLGCANGTPVTQTSLVAPPYTLQSFTTYTFTLSFSTGDASFHKNCFYECNLAFTEL